MKCQKKTRSRDQRDYSKFVINKIGVRLNIMNKQVETPPTTNETTDKQTARTALRHKLRQKQAQRGSKAAHAFKAKRVQQKIEKIQQEITLKMQSHQEKVDQSTTSKEDTATVINNAMTDQSTH